MRRIIVIFFGIIAILSIIRIATGASDLTSVGTAKAALLLSVPIVLAALGGLFAERAGVVNIGLEGMMIMGAWAGGFIGSMHGPWMGLVGAVIFGAVGALVHAVATITFGVDHVVSGVAINIIAAGLVRYISTILALSAGKYCGWQSPDLLGSLGEKIWFLISDISRVLRGLTGELSYVTMIAVALVPLSYFILWKTSFGLRLRSTGESPIAAESLGVNVYAMKYWGVLLSGGFAGLGGGFLAIVAANHYQENQIGGRGYIGLAAMLFGNWRPGGLFAGAALFGFADALQLRDSTAIHALLLLIVAFLLFASWRSFKKAKIIGGLVALAVAAFFAWFFIAFDELPGQLVTMTPYLATLIVLSFASQRLRGPAAAGFPYRRGGLK